MRFLRLILTGAAVAALAPSAAQAAPSWTAPVTLGQGAAPVVFGSTIAFNAPGSQPGAALLRSVNGAPATQWAGSGFDTTFGAFSSDGRTYVGTKGKRVAIARRSGDGWKFILRGPQTGGARVAAAPGAAVFSTFEPGDVGNVYLVRGTGAAVKLSDRGHIRSVAVASDAKNVLVAWDLRGTVEARIVRNGKPGPVHKLGTVAAAMELSASLRGSHSLVAWVDQRVNEGESGQRARIQQSVNLGKAKTLDTFPDTTVPSGAGVLTAYTSNGHAIVAWSGRQAVRTTVDGGAPVDIAPTNSSTPYLALGLGSLAVSGDGRALISLAAPTDANGHGQVYAAQFAGNAFGPAAPVGLPGLLYGRSSAGFDATTPVVAWSADGNVMRATN